MRHRVIVAVAVLVALTGIFVLAQRARSQNWPPAPETRYVRQGDQWTLSHISSVVHATVLSGSLGHVSSVTHVGGAVQVRDKSCATCTARVDHYNAVAIQDHISGAVRMWQVAQCGSTAAQAVGTDANRRDLIVKNIGTTANVNIWIGFGTTGHVALSAANGYALGQHEGAGAASSQLVLPNYQGPLSCISTVAGMTLGVVEILR